MATAGTSDAVGLLRARNFRDLGGQPSRGGLVVAPGHFFRGSAPSQLGLLERQALARLNLRRVIDLRTPSETAESNTLIPGAELLRVPLFETARPNWIVPSDQTPQATAARYFEMVTDGLFALGTVIARVAQPDTTPFLVCCTAGRDRTGIVVACLLDLLDVPDEAIASDYAESDFFDQQGGRALAATMLEFLDLIRSRHGSTARMLSSSEGFADDLQRLRSDLLVPPT